FDSNARRHTSFASVGVFPVIDDRIVIDIKEADVRTDTMRSGGAGGQHVNKTESAVRLTHIPTGIAVVVQAERSQHKNRAAAWKMLRARLYERELKKREEKAAAEQAAKTDIGWGHQIRSYVLQPYQMVKDLRTGVSTSNTGAVLDGDLDNFMQAALAQKAFGTEPSEVEDVEKRGALFSRADIDSVAASGTPSVRRDQWGADEECVASERSSGASAADGPRERHARWHLSALSQRERVRSNRRPAGEIRRRMVRVRVLEWRVSAWIFGDSKRYRHSGTL